MSRPPGSRGEQTRERILDVALELFSRQGYDTTSLRDIAARLQITKAALYYYFERKEDMLLELHRRVHLFGDTLLDELEAAPDGPARAAIWPRLADQLIDFMMDNRDLMLLHQRNRHALVNMHLQREDDLPDIEDRMLGILASPAIPLRERVRMAAVTGVITEVLAESGAAFQDVPPHELAELVREAVADLVAIPVDA